MLERYQDCYELLKHGRLADMVATIPKIRSSGVLVNAKPVAL